MKIFNFENENILLSNFLLKEKPFSSNKILITFFEKKQKTVIFSPNKMYS
jgi:hypothetical protein